MASGIAEESFQLLLQPKAAWPAGLDLVTVANELDRGHAWGGGEEALVELAPLAGQAIAERAGVALHRLARGLGIDPRGDFHAEPRIVPPRGMEARQRLHHAGTASRQSAARSAVQR
ncbi:MAG: hypothetical protein AB7O57_18760 [Hyphomicrobiaceae bacterium]